MKVLSDTTNFWTRGYDRDTEWQKAFEDGKDRSKGYGRGFIEWVKHRRKTTSPYFTGKEVEQINFGMDTLFVVGVQPVDEIAKRADERNITHIYLGTSQSFHPKSVGDWNMWNKMICGLIQKEYKVTLDFKVEYIEDLMLNGWHEFHNFTAMISVVMPKT